MHMKLSSWTLLKYVVEELTRAIVFCENSCSKNENPDFVANIQCENRCETTTLKGKYPVTFLYMRFSYEIWNI